MTYPLVQELAAEGIPVRLTWSLSSGLCEKQVSGLMVR